MSLVVNVMISPPLSKLVSVLVVDDEPALRKVIQGSLAAGGFAVEEAGTGRDAVAVIRQRRFDIVLLDVNMPGISGVDACRQIRALVPRAGIIMVTVCDSEEDKVRALEAGADDYITKPFQLRELVARLRAVLRRTQTSEGTESGVLQAGDLRLEFDRNVLWKQGQQIRLSPKEFDLLAFLMKHQGAPVTHVKLLRAVWGPEYGGEFEYLRSYVCMLRKKIEDDPARPEYILTEPWVGYRFRNAYDSDESVDPPKRVLGSFV
jgi:two-component system, OmpR family, KDP operon response regulator KdpE